jgi:hypothetical protein
MILRLLCIWLVFYTLLLLLMHGTMNLKKGDKQCLATRNCRDKIAWFSLLAPYLSYPGRMQGICRAAALNLAVRDNMIFI